jgi:hypothetical protein
MIFEKSESFLPFSASKLNEGILDSASIIAIPPTVKPIKLGIISNAYAKKTFFPFAQEGYNKIVSKKEIYT